MKNADNDDEPLTFITLGAVTANVIGFLKLDEKQNKPGAHDGGAGGAGQSDNRHDGGKIDHPLKQKRTVETVQVGPTGRMVG